MTKIVLIEVSRSVSHKCLLLTHSQHMLSITQYTVSITQHPLSLTQPTLSLTNTPSQRRWTRHSQTATSENIAKCGCYQVPATQLTREGHFGFIERLDWTKKWPKQNPAFASHSYGRVWYFRQVTLWSWSFETYTREQETHRSHHLSITKTQIRDTREQENIEGIDGEMVSTYLWKGNIINTTSITFIIPTPYLNINTPCRYYK